MSKVFIEESTLTAIGNAIREKNGSSELIAPLDMDTAITSLATMPPEELVITGDCHYKFASPSWNWYIENYKNNITTNNITDCSYMFFNNAELTSIPFTINVSKEAQNYSYMFQGTNITSIPTILSPTKDKLGSNQQFPNIRSIFKNCKTKYIPYNLISNLYGFNSENWALFREQEQGYNLGGMFEGCSNIRTLPTLTQLSTNLVQPTTGIAPSGFMYNKLFYDCESLDEITYIPIQQPIKTNAFSNTFDLCFRAKNITFTSGVVAKWTNQTIDLSQYIGFHPTGELFGDFDRTTEITDSETYNSLKNNSNSWTALQVYSRYDKTSAINTINSLPDTSAFIAEQGGTNTIKFSGTNGFYTDGGAIIDLTEEQIAVATAKGWTVSFV